MAARARERLGADRFIAVWVAFAGLLLVSRIAAPSSVTLDQMRSLLFFAAILGIAAIGQHMVVAVGGLDLSVGSTMTLSGIVFAAQSKDDTGSLITAALIAVLLALLVGVVNGIAVVVLGITSLIATLAVGSLALGAAYQFTGGSPKQVAGQAHDFVFERHLGGFISVGVSIWIVLTIGMAIFFRRAVVGRRLVAVGASPTAMNAMGFHVKSYQIAAYVGGSAAVGLAGILLSAAARLPSVSIGADYMILTIAAVVIGGTPLGGGVGSIVATAGGALFVTQLKTSTASLQASTATQLMVQGAVMAIAVALYGVGHKRRLARSARSAQEAEHSAGQTEPAAQTTSRENAATTGGHR